MENKQQNFSRSVNSKTCQSSEANRKSSDLQLNKARRRDHSTAAKNEQTRYASKQTNNNNATKQKQQNRFNADKRPRPRGGGGGTGTGRYQDGAACESEDLASAGTGLATGGRYGQHGPSDYELNSVYAAGSKKHNLNHLLNFHYAPREADYAMHGLSFFGRHSGGGGTGSNGNSGNNKARIRQHKYNKEQFLQANFQFVIRAQAKPKFDASPDALIDWNLIEQINIQTTEEPQCPICLYPPIAAKITRCGHVYCWPCLLHYLSLADKSWRKCPICYEAIHAADLKSCTIMQQQTVNVSEPITFRLMRRRRGSLFIEPYVCASPSVERYPQFSKNDMMQRFSKFLIANRSDVHEILERERRELSLSAAIDEGGASGSEYVFIEQALSLLQERFEKLVPEQCEEIKEEQEEEQQLEKPEDSSVVDQVVTEHAAVAQSNLLTIDEHTESLMTDTESLDSGEHLSNASALTPTDSDSLTAASDIISPDITGGGGNSTKYHYFYQSEDGQNNYLHPLNIKMLQACYGSLDKAPLIITAKIVQREQFTMDDDHRRKLTCLSHLPLTCQLSFVEVDLQPPIVSSNILKIFKADIMYRRKERQRRQREECKREKHINELNDRQMGKLIASAANLNMNSPEEFPTCGFDDLPPLASSAGSSNGGTPAPRQNVFSYSTVTKVDDSWPATGPPRRNNAHFQELSSVGQMRRSTAGNKKLQPVSATPAPAVVESCDGVYSSMSTCLGDVLAEAFSQKHTTKGSQHKRDELQSSHNLQQQQQGSAGGAGVTGGTPTSATTKKSKKSKKMVPIFATGMNYNGNN